MNERDEFLRDRLQPDQPEHPRCMPPARSPSQRSAPGAPRALRLSPPARDPPRRVRQRSAASADATPPRPAADLRLATAAAHRSRRPRRDPPRPPQQPAAPAAAAPTVPRRRSPRAEPAPSGPPPAADRLPDRGWRRILRLLTFGLVNPGRRPHNAKQAQYEAAIRTVLRGNHKVGVLGKGGVGKTSVAASVGSLFAELRQQDHVVAIDADTAFGRLSSRIDPRSTGSFWELTADKNLESFTDVAGRVGRNSVGLHVLAGEPASGPRRVLDPAIYREAALRLDRHFTISVIDCGSTMDSPVTQEVLRDLDALIVVSSPWADGASAAARTMEWLSDQGLTELLHNTHRGAQRFRRACRQTHPGPLLAREFVDHGQPVVEVPFDPHLRPGGVIDVSHEMAAPTRRKFLQVTAMIAGYFAARPDRARDRRPADDGR